MPEGRSLLSRIRGRLAWEAGRVAALPKLAGELLWDTPLHDLAARFGRVRVTTGAMPDSRRVAIYVIFPTDGLLESHRLALRHIADCGYAPLVVTHVPLSPGDREAVLGLSWRLIERPNFGYDFGGYRAAVLSLGDDLPSLSALALLNDSVWFPVPGGRDWLKVAEEAGTDVVGAVSNYGIQTVALDRPQDMRWAYDPSRPDFHYCSFALWFGPAVLNDPKFRTFWRRFHLTDNKFRTVRRGEVGLSQWLLARGYSHRESLGTASFGDEVGRMDAAEVEDWLKALIIPEEPDLAALGDALLARRGGPDWAQDARAYLLLAVARTGMSYALPAYALRVKGHSMLKKSPLKLALQGAERTVTLVETLQGPGADIVRVEARTLMAARNDRRRGEKQASGPPQ
ncbi:MAG: hypothetical protein J0L76_19800 [Rhodobacterales bacterium]|nr:hypothetical protein [Rhodobacterales bacterium]